MIKREDLAGKPQQVFQAMLEEAMQQYNVEVNELADEEEIIQREQELIQLMTENDEHLKTVTYAIPESFTFDGQSFNKKTACEYIVDFINSQEVEWSYSLGLYELVKIWKNKDITEIPYHAYDSTLRVLGTGKYKGFDAWRRILAINEFMTTCHEDYVRDTSYMIYLSQMHNVLIDALKKFNPDVMEEPSVEAGE